MQKEESFSMAGLKYHPGLYAVLFVAFALFWGSVLRELSKKVKIPSSVFLIVCGFFIGYYSSKLDVFGVSSLIFVQIDPNLVFFVFIPVLFFEAAYSTDFYIVKRELMKILLLAGPGLLTMAFLHAICFKYVLQYSSLTWLEAMMVGFVFCPNAPGAIVAQLTQMGASGKFITLIQGEGLLSSGFGFFFFTRIYNYVRQGSGVDVSLFDFLLAFIRAAGGGALLGLAVGIICVVWLRRIIRDDILVNTVTFLSCYIMYYFASFSGLRVSGTIALIVLGLFLSAFGKTSIRSEHITNVKTVWSFSSFCMGTVLVFFQGNLIGQKLHQQQYLIDSSDLLRLIVFYILMMLIRFLVIFLMLPLLNQYGAQLQQRLIIILAFAGLKGAGGVVQAVIVFADNSLPDYLKFIIVFYNCGVVLISNSLNPLVCKSLVKYFNLIQHPPIRYKILDNSLKELMVHVNDRQEGLKANKFLKLADWAQVRELIGLEQMQNKMLAQYGLDFTLEQNSKSTYCGIQLAEIYSDLRFRLIRTMKGLGWKQYEGGQISKFAYSILEESYNISLDNTKSNLEIWDQILLSFSSLVWIQFFFKLKNIFLIGSLARSYILEHLALIYETATSFIIIAQETISYKSEIPMREEYVNKIIDELSQEIAEAEQYIFDLYQQFPNILKAIHTKRASMVLLDATKTFVAKYHNKGFIENNDFAELQHQVDRRVLQLENSTNLQFEMPDLQFFVMQFPIFHHLTQEQLEYIQENSQQEKVYEKGALIFQKGDDLYYFFIILEGLVEVEVLEAKLKVQKGIGCLLTCSNLVDADSKANTTAKALSRVRLKCIPYPVVKAVMQRNIQFQEQIYKQAIYKIVRQHEDKAGILAKFDENRMNEFIRRGTFHRLQEHECIQAKNGGYLFTGELEELDDVQVHDQLHLSNQHTPRQNNIRKNFQSYSVVTPTLNRYTAIRPSLIIVFAGEAKFKVSGKKILKDDCMKDVNKQYDELVLKNIQLQQNMDHLRLKRKFTLQTDKLGLSFCSSNLQQNQPLLDKQKSNQSDGFDINLTPNSKIKSFFENEIELAPIKYKSDSKDDVEQSHSTKQLSNNVTNSKVQPFLQNNQ